MDTKPRQAFLAELLGTFAVVYFGAGAVCVNFLASLPNQPGLVGVAFAQGLIVAATLMVTVRLSGGFLNPAVTLTLWVFHRLDSKRTGLLVVAQLVGALIAGACIRFTFSDIVLAEARMGSPHLSPAAFPRIAFGAIATGVSVELILTFFLVFAIFGAYREGIDPQQAALPAGLILVAGTFVAGPLTGAAANPARWLGTVFWEQLLPDAANPWGDTLVFLAGPILGSLLAGLVMFRVMATEPIAKPASAPPKKK